jgi:starch-binding outer membrane protein, SusD/RagB family
MKSFRKMKKINKYVLIVFAATALVSGCKKMDVSNGNNPDLLQVLATPEDVELLASGVFNTVFSGEHSAGGVEAMLATGADHVTCSWGNFGMRDMSWEPRDFAWNNSPAYANAGNLKSSYDKWYSAIGSASDVLRVIAQGVSIDNGGPRDARAKAFSKFVMGLSYGNMSLVFDRVHVVDDTKTAEPNLSSAIPYKEVAAAALGYLQEAITLTDGSFSIPAAWLGTPNDVSGNDFKKIINTCAARILAYLPRSKAELATVDWPRVKTFADAGITASWIIQMDGTSRWSFEAGYYLTYPGWGRTDMRVVNMMAPSLPDHWPDVATFPHPAEPATSLDARLKTDFQYMGSNDFLAARGYYHFTCYRNKRYDGVYINVSGIGPKPEIMLAENDMLRAEARAYTGDLSGAAAIINAGTYVTRGQMAPVAAELNAIVKAMHHERQIEMYTTGCGLQFYEMRKLDLLQKGTPLHFPIPAATLQLLGETTFYTFGTTAKADGTGTSNGGWR